MFPDNMGKFRHLLKHRNKRPVFVPLGFILCFQYLRHTCVAHPLIHPDHGLRDLMIDHVSFRRHRHDAAQCQTIFPGIQRTDPVG